MTSIAAARTARHPPRIVHLGLGAFHRAHEAWYTQHANALAAGDGWGIAAFTGRSPDAARVLAAQDAVYTLVRRAADGDTAEIVESISHAADGGDGPQWRDRLAAPETAIVTLTVTEAGYHLAADGSLALDEPIAADLAALRRGGEGAMRTAPGRLVDGLASRRAASGGAAARVALLSCDNLAANGEALRRVVLGVAERLDDGLAAWVADNVSFVSTMVDRITPAATDADREVARALTGYDDAAPVVAEPFSEWVIAGAGDGAFPAGRPAWERVGVRIVDDVAPFERRKLWLLNAAHSLMAYVGLGRGLATVADAWGDPGCSELVEQLWSEARPVIGLPDAEVDAALAALRERFANPRIAHRLAQIALGGEQKLEQRQRSIMAARRSAGVDEGAACRATLDAYDAYLLDARLPEETR